MDRKPDDIACLMLVLRIGSKLIWKGGDCRLCKAVQICINVLLCCEYKRIHGIQIEK